MYQKGDDWKNGKHSCLLVPISTTEESLRVLYCNWKQILEVRSVELLGTEWYVELSCLLGNSNIAHSHMVSLKGKANPPEEARQLLWVNTNVKVALE